MDNIKMDLVEIKWGCVDWIGPAQDRENCTPLPNAVMIFGFHEMLVNYRVAEQILGSQVSQLVS
jgi:hypothetical protein